MGAWDWLGVGGYCVLATLLGLAAVRACRLPPSGLVHDVATYFFAGQLVLTIATLATGFVPLPHEWLLPGLLPMALAGAVAAWRDASGRVAPRILGALGFVLLVFVLFPNLLLLVQRTPTIETDARYIWLYHGKALFFAGGIDAGFFADPLLAWSSPDYPLLLPAQAAWSSLLVGRWDELACRAFLLGNFAMWFRMTWIVMRAKGYPWWLALFVAGAFVSQGAVQLTTGYSFVSGQADYHCAVPLALACLVLSVPRREGVEHTALVVVLLAYAACTKSEGTVWALAFATLWLASSSAQHLRRGVRAFGGEAWSARGSWSLAVALGALPVGAWMVWKAQHGLASNLRVVERLTTPGLVEELVAGRLPTVLRMMRDDLQTAEALRLVLLLVIAVAVGIVLRARGRRGLGVRRVEVLTTGWLLAVVASIATVYVLTPHDYVFHMQTSITRLLFFPNQLLFVLCVLRLDALWTIVGPWFRWSRDPVTPTVRADAAAT